MGSFCIGGLFCVGEIVLRWGDHFGLRGSFCNGGWGGIVSLRNSFLANSTKTFIIILVVKHVTCNTKVGDIISFCDLRNAN